MGLAYLILSVFRNICLSVYRYIGLLEYWNVNTFFVKSKVTRHGWRETSSHILCFGNIFIWSVLMTRNANNLRRHVAEWWLEVKMFLIFKSFEFAKMRFKENLKTHIFRLYAYSYDSCSVLIEFEIRPNFVWSTDIPIWQFDENLINRKTSKKSQSPIYFEINNTWIDRFCCKSIIF